MRNTHSQKLQFYQTPSGSVPLIEWFMELKIRKQIPESRNDYSILKMAILVIVNL